MKIGLLPLYVKLYDDKISEIRPRLESFYKEITNMFEEQSFEVVTSPFCRLKDEFGDSVDNFEKQNVDAIVTLHMAYSPSLECIEALANTKLPIVVLDTTQTYEFTNKQDPGEIMYCHGVHGVMDMCSMLTRYGKKYAIAAGHCKESDVISRVCGFVRAAKCADALKKSKVCLVGGAFDGMGDFRVEYGELENTFGIKVTDETPENMKKYVSEITFDEIEKEKSENKSRFDFGDNIIEEEYTESVKSCLAMRKCIKNNGYTAFSVNFSNLGESAGLCSMPFIEACKSMEKGIGYAGEGDVLTAAFVGSLLQGYPDATFVEIFCPDWKNGTVFLSHMGEINYRDADEKPVIKRVETNYSPALFPYVGYTRYKPGKGVYMNVCKTPDGFRLVLENAEMLGYKEDNFHDSMRGWMKPESGCSEFLEKLSRYGATHHSIFVYGASADELEYFGRLLNMEIVKIG